jgi:hypothetical protein
MRAFRAITTGHSNRRRTQVADFEALEICFPESREEQQALANDIVHARRDQKEAANTLKEATIRFSDVIDGRGDDVIFSEDQIKDTIDCGSGTDRYFVDSIDDFAANCEIGPIFP